MDLETNLSTFYNSISAAARALNIQPSIIIMYLARNQQKPYKGRYIVKKVDEFISPKNKRLLNHLIK
jgi:hypothetical protein